MKAEGRHALKSDLHSNAIKKVEIPKKMMGMTHGLLGQTAWDWHALFEGNLNDYVIHSRDIFGDDFTYNQYGQF